MQKVRVRNRPGRPTKKTEDRAVIILRALENGATRKAASAIAGMCEPTFYEWVAQDPAFAKSVEQAQAKFIESAAKKIAGHAPSLLKWTMMLQRADPQLQPVQEKMAIEHEGVMLQMVVMGETDEDSASQDIPSQDTAASLG
jgi:transposase-like protein